MANGILTNSGERVFVTVPTRYHSYTADGRKFSLTSTADFLADAGFDGTDLSLDQLEPDGDDVLLRAYDAPLLHACAVLPLRDGDVLPLRGDDVVLLHSVAVLRLQLQNLLLQYAY